MFGLLFFLRYPEELNRLKFLEANGWTDTQTDRVEVVLLSYNREVDILTFVTLTFTLNPSGNVVPTWAGGISSASLRRMQDDEASMIWVWWILLLFFLFIIAAMECWEVFILWKRGQTGYYLSEVSNLIDWAIVVSMIVYIGFYEHIDNVLETNVIEGLTAYREGLLQCQNDDLGCNPRANAQMKAFYGAYVRPLFVRVAEWGAATPSVAPFPAPVFHAAGVPLPWG